MTEVENKSEPRIVEGVGVAVHSEDVNYAQRIEKAMSDAILKALDDGVTDPEEQRGRMMAARDEALKG